MTRRWVRAVACLAGLGLLAFGVQQLLTVGPLPQVADALVWLAAVLVVHDGLLAPLAALAGRLPARLARRGAPSTAAVPVAAGLSVGAVLILLALPALLSPGVPDNATVLPRGYGHGLALLLTLDLVLVAATAAARVLAARGRRPHPGADLAVREASPQGPVG